MNVGECTGRLAFDLLTPVELYSNAGDTIKTLAIRYVLPTAATIATDTTKSGTVSFFLHNCPPSLTRFTLDLTVLRKEGPAVTMNVTLEILGMATATATTATLGGPHHRLMGPGAESARHRHGHPPRGASGPGGVPRAVDRHHDTPVPGVAPGGGRPDAAADAFVQLHPRRSVLHPVSALRLPAG